MNSDGTKLNNADLTGDLIACAMEVLNTLGHGLLEKPYENALAVEFKLRGTSFRQQPLSMCGINPCQLVNMCPILLFQTGWLWIPRLLIKSRIMNWGRCLTTLKLPACILD